MERMSYVSEHIRTQEEDHRRMTFQEESVTLLKRHRIDYDERHLWD